MTSWQTFPFPIMHVACCVNCVQEVVEDSLRVLMVNAFLDYTTAMSLLIAWMPVMNVIAASLSLRCGIVM